MTRGFTRCAGALAALLLAATTAACSDEETMRGDASEGASQVASEATTPVVTLTAVPLPPDPPPTGKLIADLRQSSRDAALGRIEVWINNDTVEDVTPTRISYSDPRFQAPLPGDRLRLNPSRSERGYPLYLPAKPVCQDAGDAGGAEGTLAVTFGGRTVKVDVTDDNDLVNRYVASRCLELAVAEVADLHWADRVPVDSPGEGSTGTFVLVADPTGIPGHEFTIDAVGGTPLFSAAGQTAWAPAARITSDGPAQRIELPVQPARCDDHVFMEAAGATAFLVTLHLDGKVGQLVLRMSPAGTSAAIAFARDSCGLGG